MKDKCKSVSDVLNGDGFDIPWDLIQNLVDWIVENCFNRRESFTDAARNPSRWQMLQLHRRAVRLLRQEGFRGRVLQRAANALTDTVLAEASTATDDELGAIYEGE